MCALSTPVRRRRRKRRTWPAILGHATRKSGPSGGRLDVVRPHVAPMSFQWKLGPSRMEPKDVYSERRQHLIGATCGYVARPPAKVREKARHTCRFTEAWCKEPSTPFPPIRRVAAHLPGQGPQHGAGPDSQELGRPQLHTIRTLFGGVCVRSPQRVGADHLQPLRHEGHQDC